MIDVKKKDGRGGKRAGAGRAKKRLFGSKVMRVPENYTQAVTELIKALDSMSERESKAKLQTEPMLIHIDAAEKNKKTEKVDRSIILTMHLQNY